MENKERITDIIEYFKELRSLWQTRHRETIDEKYHNTTKYFSTINIIMTIILVALSVGGIFFTAFNTASHDLSDLVKTISNMDVPNATAELREAQFNLTRAELDLKATNIQTTYSIIKIGMYGFFVTLVLIFLLNLLSVWSESRYYKMLRDSEKEIIELEEIITLLYSIKIKHLDKLEDKRLRDKLFLFDKLKFDNYRDILQNILRENEKAPNKA